MITTTFDQLFTFESIYAAHKRSRRARRSKKPIVKFELSSLANIYDLYRQLRDGVFKFGKYNTFIVYEPKRREIQNMRYSDRVIQHVICDTMLSPYFSRLVVFENCVCQRNKGTFFALRRFENKLREHIAKFGVNGYFLKCDILKYFAAIPHENLKKVICPHIADSRIREMIAGIIDGYHTNPAFLNKYGIEPLGEGALSGRGIPIGNQTSQIFGMYYLDPVDRLIKEKFRTKIYSRYMDDFVTVCLEKDEVMRLKEAISAEVKRLGLQLNSKTQIFPLKNGVTFLGFRFFINDEGKIIKTVKKQTKRRFRWRVRLLKKAYLEGIIDVNRVRQTLGAFHGHLKYSHCIKFERELNSKFYDKCGNLKHSQPIDICERRV